MVKLALLGVLMLVAAGTSAAASASGVLQEIIVVPEEKVISVETLGVKLSAEQMEAAEGIALADPRVQAMLEGADNYRIQVSSVVDVGASGVRAEDGKLIISIEKEKAITEIRIHKDYGEEFGLKVVEVTVDLLEGEVKEIEEYPEVRKPKVHEGIIISTDELLGNPSKYHGQVVSVSGTMSDLGLLRGPCFTLDGKPLIIWYLYDETNIYPTQIKDKVQNGDRVVVTGKFFYNPNTTPQEYTMYAEKVEKVIELS